MLKIVKSDAFTDSYDSYHLVSESRWDFGQSCRNSCRPACRQIFNLALTVHLPKSQRMLSEFQSGDFCWALCSLPWLLQGLSCQPRDTRLRTSVCLVLFPLGFLIICLQEISKTSLPECACIAISLGSSSDSSTTNSFSSESFSGSCNSSHHLHSATGLRGQPAQLHRQGWEMFTQWFGSEYNL